MNKIKFIRLLSLLIILAGLLVKAGWFFYFNFLYNIFISEKASSSTSIVRIFSFILIALSGIFIFSDVKIKCLFLGGMIAFIASFAIFDHIISQPFLYYSIAGRSSAMALTEAILFGLYGIGFILCGKTVLKQN